MTSDAAHGWVPSDREFAARLALIRNRMGWNLKEAALACGLPPSSWTNWETKGKRPHDYVQVCQLIATRTGASVEWLALGTAATREASAVGAPFSPAGDDSRVNTLAYPRDNSLTSEQAA